jgi:hypothetical protein
MTARSPERNHALFQDHVVELTQIEGGNAAPALQRLRTPRRRGDRLLLQQ